MLFGLGANLGDRRATLRRALDELRCLAGPLEVASLYRSAPIYSGGRRAGAAGGDPDYLNTVALGRLDAATDGRSLLFRLKELERRAGRRPGARDAPRPLDIDLLLAGSARLELPALAASAAEDGRWPGALVVPHPRLRRRRFVLEPLAELAPRLAVPPDGRTPVELLAELLAEAGDGQDVERVGWSDPV